MTYNIFSFRLILGCLYNRRSSSCRTDRPDTSLWNNAYPVCFSRHKQGENTSFFNSLRNLNLARRGSLNKITFDIGTPHWNNLAG